jgi:hypothetical protein
MRQQLSVAMSKQPLKPSARRSFLLPACYAVKRPKTLGRYSSQASVIIGSDLVAAASAIVEAIAEGAVTPSEAAALSTAVSGVAKAVETYELTDRLAKLEDQPALARPTSRRRAARRAHRQL